MHGVLLLPCGRERRGSPLSLGRSATGSRGTAGRAIDVTANPNTVAPNRACRANTGMRRQRAAAMYVRITGGHTNGRCWSRCAGRGMMPTTTTRIIEVYVYAHASPSTDRGARGDDDESRSSSLHARRRGVHAHARPAKVFRPF
jgi:hypothetical protein